MNIREIVKETLIKYQQQDYKRGGVSICPTNYEAIANEIDALVTELNERNSVDEGEKSSYRIKKCESCGCEFEANIAKLCYRCWSEQEIQNDEILKNKEG